MNLLGGFQMGDVIAMLSFCGVGLLVYLFDKPIKQWTSDVDDK